MAFSEPISATLTVDDIAALSDAELAKFMKKHRRPNGDFELPVDGWDELTKNERNRLAERLKAQERALAQNPTACSHPLDLDALDIRLRDVVDNSDPTARDRPRLCARRTITPPDFEIVSRNCEIKAYHDLIYAGGRPLYTIDRLEEVFENPEEWRELIEPWAGRNRREIWALSWGGGATLRNLFQTQLARWKEFREWQNDNRGIEDDDIDGFPAYLESRRQWYELSMRKEVYAKWLAKVEADPSSVKSDWERDQGFRQLQGDICREPRCNGFLQYAEAVKRRLAQHDFTRPFRLHDDPKQQDTLTTWIEYLNFEYWWLDRYTKSIENLKPAHDEAWQELVDLKVLRPHETQEFIRTMASPMERQVEEDQAREAVTSSMSEAAKVYKMTQEDPQRFRIPRAKRISMLENATNKLAAAKEHERSVRTRSNHITTFIRSTFDYDDAKKDAARQSLLVQWVLEQVLLIEAEMARSETNQADPNTTPRVKKRRSADPDYPEKQGPKRQKKLDQQDSSSHTISGTAILADAEEAPLTCSTAAYQNEAKGSRNRSSLAKRPPLSVDNTMATSRGLRRSARIATRRNPGVTTSAPDNAPAGMRSKGYTKPAKTLSRLRSSAKDTSSPVAKERGLSSSSGLGVAERDVASRKKRLSQRRHS